MTNENKAVRGLARTLSLVLLAGFAVTSACSEDPIAALPAEPAEMALAGQKMLDAFGTPPMTQFRNTTFPALAGLMAANSPVARIVHDGLVPTAALGKTYTWNLGTDQYSVSNLTGAPVNGVRFAIYQQAQGGGGPAVPLVEVATVDFLDLGVPSALNLGVIIQTPTRLLAQYQLAGTLGASVVALADGEAQDEAATATQLTFDINSTSNVNTGTSSNVADFISADGTRIVYAFNLLQGASQSSLRVEKGATTILFELGNGGSSGTITINGTLAANVGPGSITPVMGSDLSAEDVAALVQMRQFFVRVPDITNLVLGPFFHFF